MQRFRFAVLLVLALCPALARAQSSLAGVVKENPGKCPLFLCLRYPNGELVFIEAHERFSVAPTAQFQEAVEQLFGEETYYAKVDNTLPERTPRRWERKTENGDGE